MNKKFIILIITAIFAVILAVLFFKSVEMEKKGEVLIEQQVDSISDSDWSKGVKEGKVTLIEYSDLQCPACKAYYPITKQIAEEFKDSITFAYRHFPLRQIHFNSQIAAQAAEAAGRQNKFWEMHDLMFDSQEEWSQSQNPKEFFEKIALNLSLDIEQFKKDLESGEIKQEVEKDYQSGLKANVNSTPTFFLNGKKIQNPRSLEEFKSIIQQEIDKNK